jgi:hypothetical protein
VCLPERIQYPIWIANFFSEKLRASLEPVCGKGSLLIWKIDCVCVYCENHGALFKVSGANPQIQLSANVRWSLLVFNNICMFKCLAAFRLLWRQEQLVTTRHTWMLVQFAVSYPHVLLRAEQRTKLGRLVTELFFTSISNELAYLGLWKRELF